MASLSSIDKIVEVEIDYAFNEDRQFLILFTLTEKQLNVNFESGEVLPKSSILALHLLEEHLINI